METVRTYTQIIDKVHANPGILTLVAEDRRDVQQMITRGMSLRWEHFVNTFDTRQQASSAATGHNSASLTAANELVAREGRHGAFVRELASVVSMFQVRTDSLLDLYSDIGKIIGDLLTCGYEKVAFETHLTKLQKIVDKLNLEGYANLEIWVRELDQRIEAVLLQRLKAMIDHWCLEFGKDPENVPNGIRPKSLGRKPVHGHAIVDDANQLAMLRLAPTKHEIKIRNQVIYLDPPIEIATQNWYAQLQVWLGVVCNLHRVKTSSYEIGLGSASPVASDNGYVNLVKTALKRML